MKDIIFKRSIRFRDEESMAWTVNIELRKIDYERRNRVTLDKFRETIEVSFTGNGPNCSGQIYGHIQPRTDSQRQLLDYWERFHLCGMRSGTDKQSEYLKGGLYQSDYKKFISIFSSYDKELRRSWDEIAQKILHKNYQYDIENEPWVRKVIDKYMQGNPILYILGTGESNRFQSYPMRSDDLYVEYLFLAIRGLYNDRGYIYGHDWLYEPVPKNMEELLNNLCDKIEAEEAELTESLIPIFDMGAEDFKATPSIINQVIELRDCCTDEAQRFIALGMFLRCTFGDLNATFEEVDDCEQLYRADGQEYYIGTYEELKAIAEGHLFDDGCYDELWREAVQAEQTELGLKDWLQQVIDIDGWCNILNSWDGKYEEYKIGDEWICVSRT